MEKEGMRGMIDIVDVMKKRRCWWRGGKKEMLKVGELVEDFGLELGEWVLWGLEEEVLKGFMERLVDKGVEMNEIESDLRGKGVR